MVQWGPLNVYLPLVWIFREYPTPLIYEYFLSNMTVQKSPAIIKGSESPAGGQGEYSSQYCKSFRQIPWVDLHLCWQTLHWGTCSLRGVGVSSVEGTGVSERRPINRESSSRTASLLSVAFTSRGSTWLHTAPAFLRHDNFHRATHFDRLLF